MTIEEIKNISAEDCEKRIAEIKEEMNTENTDIEALSKEVDAIEERKQVLIKEEEQRKALADKVAHDNHAQIIEERKEDKKMTAEEIRSSEEYVNAYAQYLKTGNDKECRALMTDLVDNGTVPVPTSIDNYINTAWENARLISRVRRTSIKGTAKYPFEYSATGAFNHTEGAAVSSDTEEQLTLGTVTIDPGMIKKWITITDEVLALKGQDFLDYVWDEIAERIYEKADANLIAAIKAAPSSATTTAAGVRSLTPAAIDCFTIFNALATLANSANQPVAIMNKQTYFNQIMSLKDTTNRPIYDIVSANGRPQYYINGVEVIFDNTLGTGANAEIIVGDLRGAIANFPDGDSIKFVNDPYSLAEQDKVKVVGKMYVGIGVVRDGYFCKVTVQGASV